MKMLTNIANIDKYKLVTVCDGFDTSKKCQLTLNNAVFVALPKNTRDGL